MRHVNATLKLSIAVAALGAGLVWAQISAHAAGRNDIPSCYASSSLQAQQPAPSGRELVIIIDRTVEMAAPLQQSARAHAQSYLRPGDTVLLYQFSGLLEDQYLRLAFVGQLEKPLEEKSRRRIGRTDLKRLDTCLQQQTAYLHQHLGQQFTASFAPLATTFGKSEIMASLQKISADLAARPRADRVVLLISDMLENSAGIRFYANNSVREIDPQAELEKARPLIANFGGARVYVHGAGLIAGQAAGVYHSSTILRKLELFWREYFSQSKARLVGFGTPELAVDLR